MPAKTTKQLYDEAQAAYHNLQLGRMPAVVVDGQDGSRVEYNKADQSALYDYIQQLAALLPPDPSVAPRYRGPAGFVF